MQGPTRSSLSSGERDIDDLAYTSPEMKFLGLLDVSVWTLLLDSLFGYFAKLHATATVPSPFCFILSIFQCAQLLFAPLLIRVEDIWPKSSVITRIFEILGFLWQGPSSDSKRVLMSFVLLIIFVVLLLFLVIRAKLFSRGRWIWSRPTVVELLLWEYVLPTFLPHLVVGVPHAWRQVVTGTVHWNIAVCVFCPIIWIIYIVMLKYLIAPRVMLEVSPLHTWMPDVFAAMEAVISLVCVFSVATKELGKVVRIIFPILNAGILAPGGVLVCHFVCMTKRMWTIALSVLCFTGFLVSVIQCINLIVVKLQPEIVLCIIPPAFVVLLLLLRMIVHKKAIAILQFCDDCLNIDVNTNEVLTAEFNSKWDFMWKVRLLIECWHPYLATWKLFEHGYSRWNDDLRVMLFLARIATFFPQRNSTMMEIATLIAQLPPTFFRTSFLMQFRLIYKTRQTTVTDSIRKQLTELQSKMESLKTLMRRFWENVLQKNTANFWDDANKITDYMNEVNERMKQMTEDYPNNRDIFSVYYRFLSEIKRDYQTAKDVRGKIEVIEQFGRQKKDDAMMLVLRVYPNLESVIQEVVDSPEMSFSPDALKLYDTSKSSGTVGVESKGSDSESQLDYVIQELTRHSKLGRVTIAVIFLIAMSLVTMVCYGFFVDMYLSGFIAKRSDIMSFLANLQLARTGLCYLNLLSVTEALLVSKTIVIDDTLMGIVAPFLYTESHQIHIFESDPDGVLALIEEIKDVLTKTIQYFERLDSAHSEVKEMNYLLYEDIVYEDKNLYTSLYQILVDATDLLEIRKFQDYVNSIGYTRMKSIITIFDNYTDQLSDLCEVYARSRYSAGFDALNGLMVMTLIFNLLLLTLPFMLQLFLLLLQARALSESFSYFPNTEIRDIIMKLGFEDSKLQEDMNHVASLSHTNEGESTQNAKLAFTFFSSFLPLLVCCLVTYYSAQTFMEKANDLTATMATLYAPFSSMYLSFERLLCVFAMDIGGIRYPNPEPREVFLQVSVALLGNATSDLSASLWSDIASVTYYFARNVTLPLRNFSVVSGQKPASLFEMLVASDYPQALDLVTTSGKVYVTDRFTTPVQKTDADFLSLWYWYTNFSRLYRTNTYYDIVEESTYEQLEKFRTDELVVLIFGLVWFLFACSVAIAFLYSKHRDIRNSLMFYHYVSPKVITQNSTVMHLIESGSISMESTHRSFANADQILSQTSQGVVITDRHLSVVDFNESFAKLVKLDVIQGKPMIDILRHRNDDHSWPDLIQNVSECLAGRAAPQFSMKISADLVNGSTVHLHCNVICMNANRVSVEGEHELIEKIAIVFDNCTESVLRLEILEHEQRNINNILLNVLPEKALNLLQSGEGIIAFDANRATVGHVRVSTKKTWDFVDSIPFDYFSKIFAQFDIMIKEFDMLNKVQSSFGVYTFAGGLMIPNAKAELCADQAVRFSMKLLSSVPDLSKLVGTEIELTIGIDIGGPVASGVFSHSHPAFQVIGSIVEDAFQLMETGVPSSIQVTSVFYETVITSGFKIRKRGEVKMKSGKTFFTYLIDPT